MTESDQVILVITSVDSESTAEQLAEKLLRMRLAACIQIDSKVVSKYWWQGTLRKENECRLTIKSTERHWIAINNNLERYHPYDVPEIIKIPVTVCSGAYKDWVMSETNQQM